MRPEPVGVTGPGGMLGRRVLGELARRGVPAVPLGRDRLDFDRPEAWGAGSLPRGLAAVVNCAAYTRVDDAEADEAAAYRVNAQAVAALAAACRAAGVPLVHVSTDYAFDGAAATPCPIDHPRRPLNAYGRSKVAGEEALESSGADWLCVRTGWLFDAAGTNFVRTIHRLLGERDRVEVVDDQRGRPTSAASLAAALLDLLAADARGMHHATDGGEASWFDLARAVAAAHGRADGVDPVPTSAFPRPAARPRSSVLDLSATEALLGPRPHWTETLQPVIAALGPPAGRPARPGRPALGGGR